MYCHVTVIHDLEGHQQFRCPVVQQWTILELWKRRSLMTLFRTRGIRGVKV